MIFPIVIFVSILFGMLVSEIIHKKSIKKLVTYQQRYDGLIAEFYKNQYWQFISIDEWLEKNLTR
jgi:hypothetical protein